MARYLKFGGFPGSAGQKKSMVVFNLSAMLCPYKYNVMSI